MHKKFAKHEIGNVAEDVLKLLNNEEKGLEATVLALTGDLGAGKTTLTQKLAKALGAMDTVISPTFVIMKKYAAKHPKFKKVVHIDAYRLNSHEELLKLGWEDIVRDPSALVVIEWPERVKEIIPSHAKHVLLSHVSEEEREIHYGNKE